MGGTQMTLACMRGTDHACKNDLCLACKNLKPSHVTEQAAAHKFTVLSYANRLLFARREAK